MTLGVLVLVLLAAYLPLCAAARQLTASEVWADSSALVIGVACAGVGVVWPLSIYAATIGAIAGHSIHILPSGDLSVVDDPAGNAAWLATAQAVVVPVLVVFWLAVVGRQALS
jgi:hypothetical protein